MFELYFDGGCLPKNPGGTATYGFVLINDSKTIYEGYGIAGTGNRMTNNIAEYTALLEGLKYVRNTYPEEKRINIYGDSLLIVNMVNRRWGKKEPHKNLHHLKILLTEIHQIMNEFEVFNLAWIPREKNKEADLLTRKAYSEYRAGMLEAVKETKKKASEGFYDVMKYWLEQGLRVSNLKRIKEYDNEMRGYISFRFKYNKKKYSVSIKEID